MPPSLYQTLLGPAYGTLPAPLQDFHARAGHHVFKGRYTALGPTTWLAKLMAGLLALPGPVDDQPFSFDLQADAQQETWQRHFVGKTMRSRMRLVRNELVEQLGPLRFHFTLVVRDGEVLEMQIRAVRLLGALPCPRWLFPAIVARETASAGRLHFHVEARMPGIGLLAAYRGHLDIPPAATDKG